MIFFFKSCFFGLFLLDFEIFFFWDFGDFLLLLVNGILVIFILIFFLFLDLFDIFFLWIFEFLEIIFGIDGFIKLFFTFDFFEDDDDVFDFDLGDILFINFCWGIFFLFDLFFLFSNFCFLSVVRRFLVELSLELVKLFG